LLTFFAISDESINFNEIAGLREPGDPVREKSLVAGAGKMKK
jgi:hypothetical protein